MHLGLFSCVQGICNKMFASEHKQVKYYTSYNERRSSSITSRSSSLPIRLSELSWERRKRKSNSIFGERTNLCAKEPVGNGKKSLKNMDKTSRIKSKKSLKTSENIISKNIEDPVRDKWANKGAAVYSVQTVMKPTRYWAQTELQYVIVLPTERRRRKSSRPPKPPSLPPITPPITPRSSTPSSQPLSKPLSKSTPPSTPPQTPPKTPPQTPPKTPPQTPPPTPTPSGPATEEEKQLTDNIDDGLDISDIGSMSESSSESFLPRSKAKPPSKPKGRFCCARRQDSG